MKQKVRRMVILLFVVLTAGTLSVPAFANAREVTETELSQSVAEQASESESADSPSAETPPVNPVEEIAKTGGSDETSNPEAASGRETPEGNMTMVEEVIDTNGARKQFVTLATKNGNFFYLIIDRDDKGNNNVYFLNQVDERDLFDLMDDKEAAGLEEDWAAGQTADQQAGTLPVDIQEEPDETKPVNKTGLFMLILVLVLALGAGGVLFFLKGRKAKAAQAMIPDPDADYEEEDEDDDDPDDSDGYEDDDFGVEEGEAHDGDVYGEDDAEASD